MNKTLYLNDMELKLLANALDLYYNKLQEETPTAFYSGLLFGSASTTDYIKNKVACKSLLNLVKSSFLASAV